MSHRRGMMTVTCLVVLGALCLPLLAQESADVCIANGIVARIRDKGPYQSVEERAVAIDKAIVEVISRYDTERPQVSLREKDGIWTVYCWDLPVIGVYPAEAEANNLPPKQLGALWVENFRKRLPLVTPASKARLTVGPPVAPAQPQPQPATAPTPAPIQPAEPRTVAQAEPTARPAEPVTRPAAGQAPEQATLLLVIDALRISRGLTEDEWIDQREQLARNLLENLNRISAGRPIVTVAPPVAPVTSPAAPIEPPATVVTRPPATEPIAGPPAPPAAATGPTPPTPAGDPSYARVPQKQRIGRKFEAARDPFFKLQNESPEQAAAVNEVLKRARKYFAAEEFDLSEQHLDQALTVLGVDPNTIK